VPTFASSRVDGLYFVSCIQCFPLPSRFLCFSWNAFAELLCAALEKLKSELDATQSSSVILTLSKLGTALKRIVRIIHPCDVQLSLSLCCKLLMSLFFLNLLFLSMSCTHASQAAGETVEVVGANGLVSRTLPQEGEPEVLSLKSYLHPSQSLALSISISQSLPLRFLVCSHMSPP
jgi:hypothetical protein